jgi:hypothetical protein
MEIVLKLDPSLFLKGELRDFLPSGFIRNVIKWIPIFSDECSPTVGNPNVNILCITKQGYIFEFDSHHNIIRTCNLGWKITPNKTDNIEIVKFVSSNGSYYVAILFQTSCYVYQQKTICFIKHTEKHCVKWIAVDDFWNVGSQQLKIIFGNSTDNVITDFNPISPLMNINSATDIPNANVSNSLNFQIQRSKGSLEKGIRENEECKESIISACKWLSKCFIDTNLITESELVARALGPDNFKNVAKFIPHATDGHFKNLETKSIVFQYCGHPLLVHSLAIGQTNDWNVTGISNEFPSHDLRSCSCKFQIFRNMKSFANMESIKDLMKNMFYTKENESKAEEIHGYVYIVQQFDPSLLHSHVGEINSVVDISNSSITRSINMPPLMMDDAIEPGINDENVLQNVDAEEISLERLCGILSLMSKKCILLSSIASEMPSAFSSCLKELKFKCVPQYPNFYYNFSAYSNLKGIILIIRNEKMQKVKVDLFAEEDNVLKLFVRQCYLILPQDSEITIATEDSKAKNSKLLKRKNCLFQEIIEFNNFFPNKLGESNSSNSSLKDISDSSEFCKEFQERKRKFENRPVHIEVPLQRYFEFQNEMQILEKETDLAFM